jgi:ribonucleoside-diphosphate reductase alpha chain
LKTTYYLRSRPATQIAKTTVAGPATTDTPGTDAGRDLATVVCSLENPESCEACQ